MKPADCRGLQASAQPFPFTALVGQDEMQLGLLIAAIDPLIGGVLILGDRGTGKSTAVRALAAVLPPIDAVVDCPYQASADKGCGQCPACLKAQESGKRPKTQSIPVPVVDLPLGATEDRILGALNLEKLMTAGVKAFEPGLLAKANRGFLYIDEINLLEDHLVDLLIDVAASGESRVEREGLSVVHPARFVLVGSGNPEEGELRPQLLDRFGLAVEVRTPRDLAQRMEVVRRREAFDRDAQSFLDSVAAQQSALREQLVAARRLLPKVEMPDAMLEKAAEICMQLGTDGLRGELSLMRAAKAAAALNRQKRVNLSHLKQVAPLVLRHRLRRDPLDETDSSVRVAMVLETL